MCHKSIPHVPALFIFLQPLTIATTTRKAFSAVQFCPNRIGGLYIKQVCGFHHLRRTQSIKGINKICQMAGGSGQKTFLMVGFSKLFTVDNHIVLSLDMAVTKLSSVGSNNILGNPVHSPYITFRCSVAFRISLWGPT